MVDKTLKRSVLAILIFLFIPPLFASNIFMSREERKANRETEVQESQKQFQWWPTDAKPAPVKDADMGGYWWWPNKSGSAAL